MDPNATLAAIRAMINDGESADVLLVNAFQDLDDWLSKGGALPNDWSILSGFRIPGKVTQ